MPSRLTRHRGYSQSRERRLRLPVLGAMTCLLLCPLPAACGGGPTPAPATSAPSPAAQDSQRAPQEPGDHEHHGHVEGAEELDRAPASLAVLTSTGEVSVVSLTDLSSTPLTTAPGSTTLSTDSRFLLLGHADGSLRLADSGVWTQDHGDHQHYYRAQTRDLGLLSPAVTSTATTATAGAGQAPPDGPALIASSATRTAITAGGQARLLDRGDLEGRTAGTASALVTATVDPGSYAAPLGSHLVVVQQEQVRLLDQDGAAVGESLPCPRPSGGITTSVGVVLACQAGVVLASLPDPQSQSPVLEWLALPPEAAQDTHLTAVAGRARRPGVVALDSQGGWWLLDARERTWSRPAEAGSTPLVAVTALDDTHDRVVGVDAEGRVHLWADGAHTAVTGPIASPGLAAATGIQVTADRVYLPGAEGDAVLEINPAAGGAVERTVPVPGLLALKVVGT